MCVSEYLLVSVSVRGWAWVWVWVGVGVFVCMYVCVCGEGGGRVVVRARTNNSTDSDDNTIPNVKNVSSNSKLKSKPNGISRLIVSSLKRKRKYSLRL